MQTSRISKRIKEYLYQKNLDSIVIKRCETSLWYIHGDHAVIKIYEEAN